MTTQEMITVEAVSKSFMLHLMGGVELPIVDGVALSVRAGECVVLGGPSGAGKSSILKMIYGNYRTDAGRIIVRHASGTTDVASASAREILRLRQNAIGYVSQFLRVIPRVSALEIAKSEINLPEQQADARAKSMLKRLSVPKRLWPLPPATFSGGEQQRINIARGFSADFPVLLLDEPTASLDRPNRDAVIELIREKKASGVAILAIFHDEDVREALADRIIEVSEFAPSSIPTTHHNS